MKDINKESAVVIGAGIAGISAAEAITKIPKYQGGTVLVDKNPLPGGEASRATQNWFHTGNLYCGLPDSKEFISSLRSSNYFFYNRYNSVYKTCVTEGTIQYDLPSLRSKYWFLAPYLWHKTRSLRSSITTPSLSNLKNFDFESFVNSSDRNFKTRIKSNLILNFDWQRKYLNYIGSDGDMDTDKIMSSLVSSFYRNFGTYREASVKLGTPRPGIVSVRYNGQDEHVPSLVVICAGFGTRKMLRDIDMDQLAEHVTTRYSPIFYQRDIDLPEFCLYVPGRRDTINVKYVKDVATIADGSSYLNPYEVDIDFHHEKIQRYLGFRPEGHYIAHKTEYTADRERSYSPCVKRLAENCFMILPGKFSQFPLAVDMLIKELGEIANYSDISDYDLDRNDLVLGHYTTLDIREFASRE